MRDEREIKRGVMRETESVKKNQNLNGFGGEDDEFEVDCWGFVSACSDVMAIDMTSEVSKVSSNMGFEK